MSDREIDKAVKALKDSNYTTAFTGAGISIASGIPPFRGEDGIWNKYDPSLFDLDFFHENPEKSWELHKKVFFETLKGVKPNRAHEILAKWEKKDLLEAVITQNIDGLHEAAGSKNVINFHGTTKWLKCIDCERKIKIDEADLAKSPPKCEECGGILKPDFVFFGEGIPRDAYKKSIQETEKAEVFLVIGTTGAVMPAAMVPELASRNGAKIIEINPNKSHLTDRITDIYLADKAEVIMEVLDERLRGNTSGGQVN
ncbi:MAG: SIR2 family NAD-dependent protein deacylase [Halanaerobiales bacterium]